MSAEPLLGVGSPNPLGRTRLGITVSSKVGGAVVRVRLRRLLREVFRRRQGELPTGLDLVLIARNAAAPANFKVLNQAFDVLARRLKGRRP